jgi:hypothetical protein
MGMQSPQREHFSWSIRTISIIKSPLVLEVPKSVPVAAGARLYREKAKGSMCVMIRSAMTASK